MEISRIIDKYLGPDAANRDLNRKIAYALYLDCIAKSKHIQTTLDDVKGIKCLV